MQRRKLKFLQICYRLDSLKFMSLRQIIEIIVRQESFWILIHSTVLFDNQEISSLWKSSVSLGRNFDWFTFGERPFKP